MNKILVVSDEESIQLLYAYELFEEGYDVITSDYGPQLMALIEQERPDLILLYVSLDQYNGLGLLQDIRNMPGRVEEHGHYRHQGRRIQQPADA